LLNLLGMPVEDPEWALLEPPERRGRVTEAVKRLLLRESQEQPVLLVFEDLHWIDPDTQALLDALVESLPTTHLLLLVNYRPEYAHRWGSKTYYNQLRLDPLPPENAQELLDMLLGPDPSVAGLKTLLIERTEGTPFFLEESIRTLVEGEVLQGERGAYFLERPVQSVEVPVTVQAVLAARIDRLDPEDKRLLQTAAVIGHEVPFALLLATTDLGESELRQGLARLQSAEFLYEGSLFPELEYTFKHALTHEVTYGSLLQERRRVQHARIVHAMETQYAGQLTDHVESLARHALQGELWDRAVIYLRQAAIKAVSRSSYTDGARFLEQALDAQAALDSHDLDARGDLLLALGEVLGPGGAPLRVVDEVAEEAFELAQASTGDSERIVRICQLAMQALTRWATGTASVMKAFPRWLERLDQYAAPGSQARVEADMWLAAAHLRAGRWAEGRQLEMRSLAAARNLGHAETLFLVVTRSMAEHWAPRGWWDRLEVVRDVSQRPRPGVSRHTLADFLQWASEVLRAGGDRDQSDALRDELEQLAIRSHDIDLRFAAPYYEGWRAVEAGRLEDAIEVGQRIIALGDEVGNPVRAGIASRVISFWPMVWLGEAHRFADLLTSRPDRRSLSADRQALWLAYQGKLDEARARLREALDELQISDGTPVRPLALLLETAVILQDREAAALLAPILDDVPAVIPPISAVTRHQAGAARLAGDRVIALERYQRALDWGTRIRFRPEVALTRLELAELLLDEKLAGSMARAEREKERLSAREHLNFAIGEFRAMKMQPALDKASLLQTAAEA
jgi:hypothetical protein